tara:strand:+ start:16986 stop:17810 length:825 start_codon:yes stop_codon:yes gene_type:complete
MMHKETTTRLRVFARRLWRIPAVAFWIGCGLLLSLGMALLQSLSAKPLDARRQQLAGWWMRGLIRLLPVQVRCHGQPATGTRLLVSNHVSWLDIVIIGAHAPVHFLSKAEVRHWPVIGWLAAAAGTLFIQRGQASGSALQEQLAAALQQGRSLVIFAEGTTTAGDQVRTFHGRLLSCAIDSATPIQPVALAYRQNGQPDRTAPFINDDEFSAHLLGLLGSPTITVELHFLDDLQPDSGTRNQLSRSAQSAVSQALGLTDATVKAETFAPVSSAA